MQINKSKKSKRQPSNNLFDDDFSAGFEDSKLDKFKPAIKVFVGIIVLMTAVWGVSAYFGSTDTKNAANNDYTSNTAQQIDDDDSKLSQCIAEANGKNPTPETSDANFYPKLISGYDAQLACYDEYPDASGAIRRSSVEYARDNAIDSSGSFKDTYTSSSSSSSKNSITGCDYSLSESEYLACSDKYYAAHSTPSSSPSSSVGNANTPTPSTPYNPPSSTSGSSSGSNGGSSSSSADRAYWQSKCEEQVRQQAGGTSLNQSQRDAMVRQCMSNHGY